ncbi:putative HAD superfamily hydrolase [Rivularia sp. PCC 7116]|uniref:HAD family hydrolase n=1 Tax=Rivularia sp. PCC 7116 TaxID=373994 RepID=UPI00029F3CE5|nr:HAD family hydrolase [Rivularia sp. PCC 7116]AFY53300.1 putative HAD superfamily hydrolase [Rivularia sp. PCC 7116]
MSRHPKNQIYFNLILEKYDIFYLSLDINHRMLNYQFKMLATDYDGTIATKGRITNNVENALLEAKQAGFLISIVTGRGFHDLLRICPQIKIFDLIIVENGAVLYLPFQDKIEPLANKPPIEFIAQLMRHDIPFHQNIIMATVRLKFVERVNALIDEFKFPLHVICHKDYGLILPTGTNKAKGLEKSLFHLNIQSNQVIAVGDASNDLDFLDYCGFKVAVANAEDAVKAKADWIATKEEGEGVVEFIREYLLV